MKKMTKNPDVGDYWPWIVVEPKVQPKKIRPVSSYKESKLTCHRTVAGIGVVGKLFKKG